jgi:AcrR family transcriptional regulator
MNSKESYFKDLDKSVRKQRIIDTAIKNFQQKGYHQATLEDFAKELGVTKGALYHYFSSKEAILSVIYMQAMENYFADYANFSQMANLNLSPPDKLRFFIRNHIQKVAIDNIAMLAVFLTEENQLPEEDQKIIRREKRRYNRVLEGIVEEGMAQGYFKQVNARLLANAILGMCNSLCRWYKPQKNGYNSKEVIELFISLLESGYLKESEAESETKGSKKLRYRKTLIEEFKAEQERHSVILSSLIKEL